MALTIERVKLVDIPINVSNKPNNLSAFNRSTATYNDSINLYEAIQLINGGGGTGTDLSLTRVGNVVTLLSSTGNDVVLPLATTSLAGLLSLEDKAIIDNAVTYSDINVGSGLTGDGSSGDPLDWNGAWVSAPLTGSGTQAFPLTVLNNSITTSHIQTGTILFSDWNQNGASNGQIPQWNGTAWVAASVALPTGSTGMRLLHNGTEWKAVQEVTETKENISSINITLASTPLSYGQFKLFKNGMYQTYNADYTRLGDVVTFTVALTLTDRVTIIYDTL